jgi:hypothetical protein
VVRCWFLVSELKRRKGDNAAGRLRAHGWLRAFRLRSFPTGAGISDRLPPVSGVR